MNICLRSFLIAVCVATTGHLFAQQKPASAPWRSEISVIVTEGAPPADVFFLGERGTAVPVRIFGFSRAPAVSYAGPATLTLWQKGKNADAKPRVLATLPLREPASPQLVFLKPNPRAEEANQPAYLGVAIDDGLQGFAPGSVRVVNLSGTRAMGEIEGRRFEAPVGVSAAQPVYTETTQAGEPMLRLASWVGEEYRLVYQAKTKLSGSERLTLFIFPSAAEGGLPKVRFSRHVVVPPPAATGAKTRF
jgi:hypothetical protein